MTNEKENDQDLTNLFQAVGRRAEPSDGARERVHAAVLDAWESLPESRPSSAAPHRLYQRWAIAATVAVVGILWFAVSPTMRSETGQIVYSSTRAESLRELHEGEVLRTESDQYLSVQLASGPQLRIAPNTQVSFHNKDTVTLNSGQVYVDAEIGALRLLTPHLQAIDIGTVYQVKTDADETWVAIREGLVSLAFANQEVSIESAAGMGEFIRVSSSGQVAEQGEIATTDTVWSWQKAARKPLALDQLDVYTYVSWLARDNGVKLQYRSSAVAQQAKLERLSASQGQNTDTYPMVRTLETTNFVVVDIDEHTWMLDFRRQ